jgi:hypothetical protein
MAFYSRDKDKGIDCSPLADMVGGRFVPKSLTF